MKSIKLRWDVVVVLIIGISLSFFTTFLLYRDIVFLVAKKEVQKFEKTCDDKTFHIEGQYEINGVTYYFSKTKLDGTTYHKISETPNIKLYYNPQFPEQACFEYEITVTWGGSVLLLFGILLILFMTQHAAKSLSK